MRRLSLILLFLIMPCLTFAASAQFEKDKDYAVVSASKIAQQQSKKIIVEEFFSYGCPWCFRLEPSLETWQKQQPAYVKLERVPVVFEKGWQHYARAYYIADSLGIEKQLTPVLFKAVQKQGEYLQNDANMIALFTKNGVKQDVAQSAFQSSPVIDAKLSEGASLMQAYQVMAVPTFVVAGKYRTDLSMAKGNNQRLLQIVDFLVKKEHSNG